MSAFREVMCLLPKLKDASAFKEHEDILDKLSNVLWNEKEEMTLTDKKACVDALECCNCVAYKDKVKIKISSIVSFLGKKKANESYFFAIKAYSALQEVSSIVTLAECIRTILDFVDSTQEKLSLPASSCALLFQHFTTYTSQLITVFDVHNQIFDVLTLLHYLVGSGVMNDAARVSIKYTREIRTDEDDSKSDSTLSLLSAPVCGVTSSPSVSTSLSSSHSSPTEDDVGMDYQRFQYAFLAFRGLLNNLGQLKDSGRPSALGILALDLSTQIENGVFFPEGTLPPLHFIQDLLESPGSPSSQSTEDISPPNRTASQTYFKATFIISSKNKSTQLGPESDGKCFRKKRHRRSSMN